MCCCYSVEKLIPLPAKKAKSLPFLKFPAVVYYFKKLRAMKILKLDMAFIASRRFVCRCSKYSGASHDVGASLFNFYWMSSPEGNGLVCRMDPVQMYNDSSFFLYLLMGAENTTVASI